MLKPTLPTGFKRVSDERYDGIIVQRHFTTIKSGLPESIR